MRIGIDLGGTKIEAIAIDGTREVLRRRVDAPRGDYTATISTVRELVSAIELESGTTGTVGIGIPGAISPATGLVKNANSTWLIGQPLDRDLARALDRPVRVTNDANCFALSEATDGAAQGRTHSVRRHSRHWHRRRDCGGRPRARRPPSHRRRMGSQPATLDAGRRAPWSIVLLRAQRLHRDVSFRARSVRDIRRDCRTTGRGGRRRQPRGIRRRGCESSARYLRSPSGPGAGEHRQRARSGRHRFGRRLIEHRRTVRADPPAGDAFRFFRFCRYSNCGGPPWRFQRGPRRGLVVAWVAGWWWLVVGVGGWWLVVDSS